MGHGTICHSGIWTMETDATSMELLINSFIVSTNKSSLCFASAIALTYTSQRIFNLYRGSQVGFLLESTFFGPRKRSSIYLRLAVDPKHRGIWYTYIGLLAD
jgi:hypothetical protein